MCIPLAPSLLCRYVSRKFGIAGAALLIGRRRCLGDRVGRHEQPRQRFLMVFGLCILAYRASRGKIDGDGKQPVSRGKIAGADVGVSQTRGSLSSADRNQSRYRCDATPIGSSVREAPKGQPLSTPPAVAGSPRHPQQFVRPSPRRCGHRSTRWLFEADRHRDEHIAPWWRLANGPAACR